MSTYYLRVPSCAIFFGLSSNSPSILGKRLLNTKFQGRPKWPKCKSILQFGSFAKAIKKTSKSKTSLYCPIFNLSKKSYLNTWRRSKKQNLCDIICLQASLKGLWSTHARLRSTPPRTCQGPWCSTYEERSTNHLIFLPQSNESETRRHESWGEQLVMPMHVHDIGKCWKCRKKK